MSDIIKGRQYGSALDITTFFTLFVLQLRREKASYDVEDHVDYPGIFTKVKFTNHLHIIDPDEREGIPVYQVLDRKGIVTNKDEDPQVTSYVIVTSLYHLLRQLIYLLLCRDLNENKTFLAFFCVIPFIILFLSSL